MLIAEASLLNPVRILNESGMQLSPTYEDLEVENNHLPTKKTLHSPYKLEKERMRCSSNAAFTSVSRWTEASMAEARFVASCTSRLIHFGVRVILGGLGFWVWRFRVSGFGLWVLGLGG